mmetsp:Transcript_37080/g.75997  ORF Transcript_37080/g.75997 Transcript_37080/m.75997 type:complete len:155 (-) Transcript_37080:613-1077(-)
MSISSSSSGMGSENKGKVRCWSKGSENLQTQFCMAFTVDFTVYNFQVAHNERRWFVQKRYSQFDKLDSTLNEKFPDVMISVQRLPPKKPFGSLSPALIAMRQKSLDAYLQGILMRPLLARSEEVRDFIEMPLDVREMDREEQRHLQAAKDALRP